MRMTLKLSHEKIADERRARYLAAWPLTAQAEALHDAANGRPDKLARMNADFAAIKAALPYPAATAGADE